MGEASKYNPAGHADDSNGPEYPPIQNHENREPRDYANHVEIFQPAFAGASAKQWQADSGQGTETIDRAGRIKRR